MNRFSEFLDIKKADASAAAPKTNPMLMLNSRELDKLSEIYDYFDHNGDGALVSGSYADADLNFNLIFRLLRSLSSQSMTTWTSTQLDGTRGLIASGSYLVRHTSSRQFDLLVS